MSKKIIIDSHVHVWPDNIAEKALGKPQSDLIRFGDGTVAGALVSMHASHVDLSISLNVANSPRHLETTNKFAADLDPERFVGFGTVHPDLSVTANVESLESNHLLGVKIHPLFQGYSLDDRRLWEVLDAIRGKLIAIIHVGEGSDEKNNARATPAMLRQLIQALPGLDIIACHFGGYRMPSEASDMIHGLDVYLDTSWPPGLASHDPETVRRAIRRHGADRVVFGSDWPMGLPGEDIQTIRNLGLTDEEVDLILGENMRTLLGLMQ